MVKGASNKAAVSVNAGVNVNDIVALTNKIGNYARGVEVTVIDESSSLSVGSV